MTISRKIVAAAALAAVATGSVVPMHAQTTIGGEKECSYQAVTTYTYYGNYVVAVTTLEKTCVQVLDS